MYEEQTLGERVVLYFDAEATPALGLLGLSLSYEMMEGLLLF